MSSPNEALLILAGTQFLATMSPGPNWMLIIRNSGYSRKLGLATAAGILPAGLCLSTASMMGGSALLATMPKLAILLQVMCGCYLIYIGARSILSSFQTDKKIPQTRTRFSSKTAFVMGFFGNITNPKSIAFFASIYAATGAFTLSIRYKISAILLLSLISFTLHSALALLASGVTIGHRLSSYSHWSKRIVGVAMIGFGLYMLVGST